MLDWMPGIILTSKLCPKHMESTVYAMLAGFQNFGQTIAMTLGLALTEIMKVNADFSGCNSADRSNLKYMFRMFKC